MASEILSTIGKAFLPKKIRPGLRKYFLTAGIEEVPYHLFGLLFLFSAIVSYFIFTFIFLKIIQGKGIVVSGFLSFFIFLALMLIIVLLVMIVVYFFLNIKIYNRTKEMEYLFPDYLTLVSTGLKGGLSFEKALWNSIKPEFKVLANEIGLVSKKVMTGDSLSDALMEFATKYNSPIIRGNIELLVSEVEVGGKISDILDHIVENLKKTMYLKKEMAASTTTYMMFIGVLVTFICPILFALSFQLFQIITGFISGISGSLALVQGTFKIGMPSIRPEDFRLFSIASIFIISFFSSMIISIIEKGSYKGGLKYFPMFIITSITIYFVAYKILSLLFSGIIAKG